MAMIEIEFNMWSFEQIELYSDLLTYLADNKIEYHDDSTNAFLVKLAIMFDDSNIIHKHYITLRYPDYIRRGSTCT